MSSSSSPPRALAILPNWLGDLVMVAPALLALRQRGPLLSLGSPAALSLLSALNVLDEGLPYDRRGKDRGFGLWRVGRKAAAWRPQEAFAFGPSLRAAALARLCGAALRHGHGGEGRALLLNRVRPRLRRDRHLAQQWLELVQPSAQARDFLPLQVGAAAQSRWQELRAARDLSPERPYVALAPGATYGPTKRWPHFAALALRLREERNLLPLIVGAGDAQEKQLCAELAVCCGGIDCAGSTDLPTLAALLQQAALFVGNDSGPMHLAAALGTPTLGIFGSSSPDWTAPLGPHAAHVGPQPIACSPCFSSTCGIGIRCLTELSVQQVHGAAVALLDPAVLR